MSAEKSESKKGSIALLAIAMSAVGLIIGWVWKAPVFGTFSPGTLITFIAFMLSLVSVKDHGSNALPMGAFWISFISMTITIFVSVL